MTMDWSQRQRQWRRQLLRLIIAAAFAAAGASTRASDYMVTSLNDSGSGSLRWAIEQSNLSPSSADTITFDSSLAGAIELGSMLPMIQKDGGSL